MYIGKQLAHRYNNINCVKRILLASLPLHCVLQNRISFIGLEYKHSPFSNLHRTTADRKNHSTIFSFQIISICCCWYNVFHFCYVLLRGISLLLILKWASNVMSMECSSFFFRFIFFPIHSKSIKQKRMKIQTKSKTETQVKQLSSIYRLTFRIFRSSVLFIKVIYKII